MTNERYKDLMERYSPEINASKWLGSAIYWLLAGERCTCRERLKKASKGMFNSIFFCGVAIKLLTIVYD